VSWILGPKPVVEAVTSAGSFLDGGGSRPLQRAAIEMLSLERAEAEAASLQAAFRVKRDLTRAALEKLGLAFDAPTDGTFYAWGSVAVLPAPLNTGMGFFRKALESKVIVVPGEFFDVNPGKRRSGRSSRFRSHVRISFGPAEAVVREGLDRLAALTRR